MLILVPIIILFGIGSKVMQDINTSNNIYETSDMTYNNAEKLISSIDFLFSSPVFIIIMGIIIIKVVTGARRNFV